MNEVIILYISNIYINCSSVHLCSNPMVVFGRISMEGLHVVHAAAAEHHLAVGFAQPTPPGDGLAAILAPEVGGMALQSGAGASARRAAKEQADRISFSDLGRRRAEIARALLDGANLTAALSSDETYQALLERRDVLRRLQGELDGLANRAIKLGERTSRRSDRSESDDASASDSRAPSSSPVTETKAGVTRSPRGQASGLVKNALYLLGGIAATGGFAAFVQETQVNKPLRDSNPQVPTPDHEKLTGVWLHPVLCDALKDKNSIKISSNVDNLAEFLAERELSFAGPTPIMRLEMASTFDDPDVQARFGMKYSYIARQSDQVVNILSTLCGAEDKSSDFPEVRDVPLHRMDMANLPKPMDAGAVLDLAYRRQEFGKPPPDSWRERTRRDAAAERDGPQDPGLGRCLQGGKSS
jgi:hypothetical protein